MPFNSSTTALVLTDPQNDFLSPDGVTWELVGKSVEKNNTVDHIEQLLVSAKSGGYEVFVSPHYYFPHDHRWEVGGTLEKKMHEIGMFDRPGPLDLEGFKDSGLTGWTGSSPICRMARPSSHCSKAPKSSSTWPARSASWNLNPAASSSRSPLNRVRSWPSAVWRAKPERTCGASVRSAVGASAPSLQRSTD